ncbi:MAG: hypothetical protein HOC77_09730 [Chloroflexi bacterium]|jgi:hypothetical protein|nr:hypothetical protein [Chloroflexota bacterium]MBT4073789.1 hypothetical protein [Chloroflexota bacterium]MBT4515354.1 hypothetical protein [Chloroflexota bacterium]MBT6682845.1 hypothetical protein [Chloroflexota bacterium]
MSLTAFLASNALLVLVLLTWNLFTLLSLRNASSEAVSRWTASIGLQWRFGAATAALIAVTVATFDAILFGESEEVIEVAAVFSMLALAVAVTHAIVSVLLFAELMGRGLDTSSSSFSDDSPWRRPVEWATVVLVPLSLLGALIFGVVAWSLA